MFRKCLLVLLMLVLLVSFVYGIATFETGDSAGAWFPSPVGSGFCIAYNVPHIPNGVKASCPRP